MREMDGIQVIEQIKGIDPDAEAIVLTGYGTLGNAIAALRDRGLSTTSPIRRI